MVLGEPQWAGLSYTCWCLYIRGRGYVTAYVRAPLNLCYVILIQGQGHHSNMNHDFLNNLLTFHFINFTNDVIYAEIFYFTEFILFHRSPMTLYT